MRLNDEKANDVAPRAADDVEAILRSHGRRATGPHVAMLSAVLRHGGPIDAATLTAREHDEEPAIHEATTALEGIGAGCIEVGS